MPQYACVPDLGIPQQCPLGPLRTLKGAVALSHTLFSPLGPGQPALGAFPSRSWRAGGGHKQASALLSVLALASADNNSPLFSPYLLAKYQAPLFMPYSL